MLFPDPSGLQDHELNSPNERSDYEAHLRSVSAAILEWNAKSPLQSSTGASAPWRLHCVHDLSRPIKCFTLIAVFSFTTDSRSVLAQSSETKSGSDALIEAVQPYISINRISSR